MMMTMMFGIDLANLAVQLEAVHAGHLDVHQGQVPALARQLQQRLARAIGGVHTVAFFLEPFSQRVPDDVFVVNNQQAGLWDSFRSLLLTPSANNRLDTSLHPKTAVSRTFLAYMVKPIALRKDSDK